VLGERGISAIHRARSLQSRITNLMAFGLMSALGVGFLGWYYVHTFAAESAARHDGQAAIRRQAAGTVHLPPLGPLGSPGASRRRSLVTDVLGPPPGVPGGAKTGALSGAVSGAVSVDSGTGYRLDPAPGAEGPSTEALARARELSGPAYATRAASGAHGRSAGAASAGDGRVSGSAPGTNRFMAEPESSSPGTNPSTGRLADLLRPTVTRAARPTVLPTRRLLLPEGAFIDCTLETAIDSTLPGMTTCITATDTFGADGTVVLLPRGTALVGETRGQMQQGSSRIFVLWTEARTPGGVVIPLDSPGTDALGRSGLTGTVNRHFWQRFGAAILISVINGGIQYGVQSQSQGGALVYEPDTTEGVMTEALKSTVDIPPTVTVPNGARIEVLVARNIDFRSVYALRPTGQ
jgi:type IV secretion system protein VirB10